MRIIIVLAIISLGIIPNVYAQTDFPALKQQFLDYRKADNQDSALFIARKMNSLSLAEQSDTSYWYALSMRYQGNIYDTWEDKDSTFFYWIKSVELFDRLSPNYSSDYLVGLANLGFLYQFYDSNNLADSILSLALIQCEHKSSESDSKCYDIIESLAAISWHNNDYVRCLNYMEKMDEIMRINQVDFDANDYLEYLLEKAAVYEMNGLFDEAMTINENAIQFSKQNKLTDTWMYHAQALSNYCVLLLQLKRYQQAFEINSQVINWALENKEYELYFQSHLHYCDLIHETKGAGSALDEVNRVLELINNIPIGEFDAEIILELKHKLLLREADYHNQLQEYTDALETLSKALEIGLVIDEEYYGNREVFIQIANTHVYKKQYSLAESAFLLAFDSWKKNSLTNMGNPHYHRLVLGYSHFQFSTLQYNAGIALLEKHVDFNNVSKKSVLNSTMLNNLKAFYYADRRYEAAYSIAHNLFELKKEQLTLNFNWASNLERKYIWIKEYGFFSDLNQLASRAFTEIPSSTELAYNGDLISKSLLLETSRELDQALASSTDTILKDNYQKLKLLRKNYSKLASEGSENKELMNRLNQEADSLDKILVNNLGEYAAFKKKFEITWKDVQSNLKYEDAAIEFAKYYDDTDSLYKYMAMVVRPEYEYPKLSLLGNEEQISRLIKTQSFDELYALVWEPMEEYLNGVKRIYYTPAGQLNNLSFNALCMGEREEIVKPLPNDMAIRGKVSTQQEVIYHCEYLMDRYELHQLTTTRYIADGTLDKEQRFNTSITLSGGINYDIIPTAYSESKEEGNVECLLAMNLQQEKNGENSIRSIDGSSGMIYLDGTKKEVDHIADYFKNKNWSTNSYTATKAEEGKFKADVEQNQPGILHIATHGFAFADKQNDKTPKPSGLEETSYKASEDPMVRCGLMLSGSNISWTGSPQKMIEETGEDGILTASEISNLDLSNTKLVVLSACETGLGKIEGSEGTFGLKRGFKLAGVEQIIVSLWSVPDKETTELMTLFYEDLAVTLNPVISFAKAQKEMRNKYPTRPDLWAGFVLVR